MRALLAATACATVLLASAASWANCGGYGNPCRSWTVQKPIGEGFPDHIYERPDGSYEVQHPIGQGFPDYVYPQANGGYMIQHPVGQGFPTYVNPN